jgi:hypothetical protein
MHSTTKSLYWRYNLYGDIYQRFKVAFSLKLDAMQGTTLLLVCKLGKINCYQEARMSIDAKPLLFETHEVNLKIMKRLMTHSEIKTRSSP